MRRLSAFLSLSGLLLSTAIIHAKAGPLAQRGVDIVSPREVVSISPQQQDLLGSGRAAFYIPGIPPHIYGQYHVRRGTHKRSNKI